MKTKLIGVTPRINYSDSKVRREFLNERYLYPLHELGFNTIMLNLDNPNNEEIFKLCDAFVITGGTDVDPKYFNEENNGESKGIDEAMDRLDKEVVEYASKNKIPTLGICRGLQVLNVFLGGSLFQDIGKEHDDVKHLVNTVPNRFFDFPAQMEVNSYHHQAINKLAPGFEVIATAEDGIIEAMIHKNLPIIAFQWHPEVSQKENISKYIFKRFSEIINNK